MGHFPWLCEITSGYMVYTCIISVSVISYSLSRLFLLRPSFYLLYLAVIVHIVLSLTHLINILTRVEKPSVIFPRRWVAKCCNSEQTWDSLSCSEAMNLDHAVIPSCQRLPLTTTHAKLLDSYPFGQIWPRTPHDFTGSRAAAGSDSLPTRLHLDWNADVRGWLMMNSSFNGGQVTTLVGMIQWLTRNGDTPVDILFNGHCWWIIKWIFCLIDKSKVRLHMLMVMLVSCWWLWYLSNTISTPHHSICARVKIWYMIYGHPCF